MSAATSIQRLRIIARADTLAWYRRDLLDAASDMEDMSFQLTEWRKVFPGKTPAEAAEIVKEVIIRLENYQNQRPLTAEEKAWVEKSWQEYKAIPRTSTEQQAKVDALGEKIWNHNFGPDAKRRP